MKVATESKFKNQFITLIILTHTWLKRKNYTHTQACTIIKE